MEYFVAGIIFSGMGFLIYLWGFRRGYRVGRDEEGAIRFKEYEERYAFTPPPMHQSIPEPSHGPLPPPPE